MMSLKNAILSLTVQDMARLDMILIDGDKDDALIFLKELRSRMEKSENKGMKPHFC